MISCNNCRHPINDSTDDNFNSDHTQIQCQNCRKWQVAIVRNAYDEYAQTACPCCEQKTIIRDDDLLYCTNPFCDYELLLVNKPGKYCKTLEDFKELSRRLES